MHLTKIKEWIIDFAAYVPGFAKAAGIVLVLTLLIISFALYSRYMRASMLDVINSDYVRTARAKGVS